MEKRKKDLKKIKEEALKGAMHDPATTDVLGSYTGTARDGGEPDQDADDL